MQREERPEKQSERDLSPLLQLFLELRPRPPAVWLLKLALDSCNTIPFMPKLV